MKIGENCQKRGNDYIDAIYLTVFRNIFFFVLLFYGRKIKLFYFYFENKVENNFFNAIINTFLQDPSVFIIVREIHHVMHVILGDLEENAHEAEQMY